MIQIPSNLSVKGCKIRWHSTISTLPGLPGQMILAETQGHSKLDYSISVLNQLVWGLQRLFPFPRRYILCFTEPSPQKVLTYPDHSDTQFGFLESARSAQLWCGGEGCCRKCFLDGSLLLFGDPLSSKETWFFLLGFPVSWDTASYLLSAIPPTCTFTMLPTLWDLSSPN